MSKLSICLRKHHDDIKPFDTADLVAAAAEYQSRGKAEDAANAEAIEDHLAILRAQMTDIEGKVLDEFKKQMPDKYAKVEADVVAAETAEKE